MIPASSIRRSILIFFFITAFVLGIAISLTPNHLTGSNFGLDGADYLAATLTRGIPHPTGYPTYTLLGILFQFIPFGTPYYRGALLSSVPAALSVGLLTAWADRFLREPDKTTISGGLVSGLVWGTSLLFLSQAVIVEVHGLQMLFVVLTLWWVGFLIRNPGTQRTLYPLLGLAWAFGIGLGNHVTLLLLAPVCATALWYALRKGMPSRWIIGQIAFVLIGLLIYIYLPLQARSYPPINWGNPQTLKGFLWVITAEPYRPLLFSAPTTTLIERTGAWFNLLRQQFGMLGILIGVAGGVLLGESNQRLQRISLWVIVVYSLFAIGYRSADSIAYLLPVYLGFAIWIGYAFQSFWEKRWRTIPWGKALGFVTIIFFLARFPITYQQVDPRLDNQIDEFAQQYLTTAPDGAILYTQSDPDTFPLWYYHFGLGWRPDVAIISLPLTRYPWYQETLIQTYPELKFPKMSPEDNLSSDWGERVAEFNPHRPVCRSQVDPDSPNELSHYCEDSARSPGYNLPTTNKQQIEQH